MAQPSIEDWAFHKSQDIVLSNDWKTFTILFKDLAQPSWGIAKPYTPNAIITTNLMRTSSGSTVWPPAGLYNGMVYPLTPLPIKGVIWFQGESNVDRAWYYRQQFPIMVKGWRRAWDNAQMPFLFVQVANFLAPLQYPGDSLWSELRESQTSALQLPQVAMATAIDVGEANNIHFGNKREVGRRLSLAALKTAYGQKIPSSGPIVSKVKVEPASILITFKECESGLKAREKGELKGFAIAGKDKIFHWAKASIKGDTIKVWHDQVPSPQSVRYDWADNPNGNLVNGVGLPAPPFRTDDWPLLTQGKK